MSSKKMAPKVATTKAPAAKAPEKKVAPTKKVPQKTPTTPAPKPPIKKPAPEPSSEETSVLARTVKKLSKSIIFVIVDEAEDRSGKKKLSNEEKEQKKPTLPKRIKTGTAEETQEELTERILKELEEQNRMFKHVAETQICTRCNRNIVSPEFWVDKQLGYCEECAEILKLGQSKEARKIDFQMDSMNGDSLDELDDDDIVGPNEEDLKNAEEDIDDLDAN